MFKEIILSFIAGTAVFISPCVLPLIPAYIFYITGLRVEEKVDNKLKFLIRIFFFIIGFTIVFTILGIITALLTYNLYSSPITPLTFYLGLNFVMHWVGIIYYHITDNK